MSPAALLLLLLPALAAAQETAAPLTPQAAADLAVKNSPAALAAEQDIIIARQRLREARFTWLPQLALSGAAARSELAQPAVLGPELGMRYLDPRPGDNYYSLRLNALQPLYTGGKNSNMLMLARAAHNQAKVAYEASRADAAHEGKRAYYTLLYRRRLAAAAASSLELAGPEPTGDTAAAKERLALRSRLAAAAREAARDLEQAQLQLQRALNRDPGGVTEVEGAFEPLPVPVSPSASLVTAMQRRADLRGEVYRARMDDIAVNMALFRRYPTIYLGASYDITASEPGDLGGGETRSKNWLASLSIHFPLSYDIWTQVQQRRAQQRQGELRRAELQDRIRYDILAAHKEALFWQGEADTRKAELEAVRRGTGGASGSTLEGLRLLAAAAELERFWLEAVYRQLLARIRLEWAQGSGLPGA
jgi:outer membrane protein TolC